MYWRKERDDYGRTVHYLMTDTGRTLGVVVKHPNAKKGEPKAYWYTRWGMPFDTPREVKTKYFTNLKDAKTALSRIHVEEAIESLKGATK